MRNVIGAILLSFASICQASEIEIQVSGEGANGTIVIDLLEDVAPQHADRISTLAASGAFMR